MSEQITPSNTEYFFPDNGFGDYVVDGVDKVLYITHERAKEIGARPAAEAAAEGLRGKELDAALDEAGLPKSGTVAEKRARLAEHKASFTEIV